MEEISPSHFTKECFISTCVIFLGERLTWLTLQLYEARCKLHLSWEEKYLSSGIERMINDLHVITVSTEESSGDQR